MCMANIREESLEPTEANSSVIAAVGAFVVISWYQVEIEPAGAWFSP